jgi:hypothetical protein
MSSLVVTLYRNMLVMFFRRAAPALGAYIIGDEIALWLFAGCTLIPCKFTSVGGVGGTIVSLMQSRIHDSSISLFLYVCNHFLYERVALRQLSIIGFTGQP